ncbi:hypothetical protein BN946_scf184705.g6 [Trametes cinnabarina]|uniref:Uncharacterized protein n=1 Tax=Pycnoporus cinnabarinus TaxID=5643 RepID=A0A060SSN3_PYCCI|nr:hypothetical protein BN946_scf184705.g6 [Trametes cinnabarina]
MADSPSSTAPQPPQDTPSFRYFRPPTSAQQPRNDLPDHFFDLTPADVRAQQAMLAARRDALHNAPLRTAAMREAEDKKRRARWPHVRSRPPSPPMSLINPAPARRPPSA